MLVLEKLTIVIRADSNKEFRIEAQPCL